MPKIDEMYAYVIEDTGPDDEGVAAFMGPSGWMPMVGADRARVDSLRQIAEDLATLHGKPIRLVRFAGPGEVIDVIEPRP